MAKINVPKSVIISKLTLNDFLRNEEEIKKFKAEKEELGLTKAVKTAKKVQGCYFARRCPKHWFCQEHEKGCAVTSPTLLENVSSV